MPNLNEKCKELPLCRMYSVKARAIMHAHLGRIPLNPDTLDKDRQSIVAKCPYLIQEMVSCVNQLIMLAYARRSESESKFNNRKKQNLYYLLPKYILTKKNCQFQYQNCQALKPLKIV